MLRGVGGGFVGGQDAAELVDGELRYPATNYRSYEMLEETPTRVRFALVDTEP